MNYNKKNIIKLIDLLEKNMFSLWNDNLQDITNCIIIENKELRDMVYQDQKEDKDFKNISFNGNDILLLIETIKKDLS